MLRADAKKRKDLFDKQTVPARLMRAQEASKLLIKHLYEKYNSVRNAFMHMGEIFDQYTNIDWYEFGLWHTSS